jgi:hypothetical protein
MFFSGLTNAGNARLGVSAAACIEHAPVGFLPGGHLTIPLFPFAIVDQHTAGSSMANGGGLWSQQIETGRGFDNVTWNPETHSVEQGPDGLPEITLTLSPNSAGSNPDSFVPLKFSAATPTDSSSQAVGWMKNGVSAADLQSLGLTQLSFPSTISAATLSRLECAETGAWLQCHPGQSFVVCLCNPKVSPADSKTSTKSATSSTLSTVQLNRPVAARIMACGVSPTGNVRVILQPCVLISSTAVMSSSPQATLNRYV